MPSAILSMQPFGYNRHGPTMGGSARFGGGELGHNLTQSLGRRSISVPSGILIHLAVWPQYTWAKNCGGGGCGPLDE